MNRWAIICVVFLLGFLGHTDSQKDLPSADDILNKVSNVMDVPDLNNLNETLLPTITEAENLFKQKCDKNGGPGVFENAKKAQEQMGKCIQSLINITQLQAEMEKYKPTGDLDIVFRNYCHKRPILQNCVTQFTTAIEPCLEEKEKESKRVIQNITDSLLSFVCFKEGDRIALFISAGGPECLESKQQAMQDCANRTLGSYIPMPNSSSQSLGIEHLPSLVFETKECNDISTLQSCIVKELEKCSDPTPANIVDSIFNFILKVTPCEKVLNMKVTQPINASNVQHSPMHAVSLLLISLITFFVLRFT